MAKSKIVVTGSGGFIGGALCRKLSDMYPRKEIIEIDRRISPWGCKNLITFTTDINQWLPTLQNVEAVIHLAALPSVRDSEKNASQVIFDNILASQKIIQQCITNWIPKKLLIASSSSVYDGRDNEFMDETDRYLKPLSIYGASKLAVEQMTKTYIDNGRFAGIHAVNMRIFTVYGPRQRDELAIQAIIDSILMDKQFTLYGDGLQRRDFTYIEDTCRAIISLMNSLDLQHNIYNIGTGKNISINEVIQKVSTYLGKSINIKYEPATIYDTNYTKANVERIYRDTGWKASMDFDVGLKNQIEWQKNESIR